MRRRRSFSRRRTTKRRAAWDWAGRATLTITEDGSPNQGDVAIILPSARTKWLANYRERDTVTFMGMLLWLDFAVYSTDVEHSGNLSVAPFIDLYAIVAQADAEGNATGFFRPFDEPEPPALMTAWDSNIPTDGNDPFLWVTTFNPDDMFCGGTAGGLDAGLNTWGYITLNGGGGVGENRVFENIGNPNVYEPNVRIKSRRRLRETDTIVLGMNKPDTSGLYLTYRLRASYRMLFA